MQKQINDLTRTYLTDLREVSSAKELQVFQAKYNKLFSALMQSLAKSSLSQKKLYGPKINTLKQTLEKAVTDKHQSLTITSPSPVHDLTIPVTPAPSGRLHPTTIVIRELNRFFRYHGFSVAEGPELETAEYNFRKLNLPEGHPATDLQDSLFVKEPDLVMRTHTSSIETRILSTHQPPLRAVAPGKVYRNETLNASNSSFFHHYQGFVVDKGVNLQHLKDILTKAHQFLFGSDILLRFRYKYYPEVSPGMGVDMQCQLCGGKGCQVCKQRGWIETLGSGMVHYNTLKLCGINPEVYTGYAFGMGLDRLVMNKYGIKDIRHLYGGDLVYV